MRPASVRAMPSPRSLRRSIVSVLSMSGIGRGTLWAHHLPSISLALDGSERLRLLLAGAGHTRNLPCRRNSEDASLPARAPDCAIRSAIEPLGTQEGVVIKKGADQDSARDRKSTRLNSSHVS